MQTHLYACTHTRMQIHLHKKNRTCYFHLIWDIIPYRIFWKGADRKSFVPKSWDNMMIRSCKIIGNEGYKILVRIQYRRVNNDNNKITLWIEAVQWFFSGPMSIIKVTLEKAGKLRVIYFWEIDSFLPHLTKFIYYRFF